MVLCVCCVCVCVCVHTHTHTYNEHFHISPIGLILLEKLKVAQHAGILPFHGTEILPYRLGTQCGPHERIPHFLTLLSIRTSTNVVGPFTEGCPTERRIRVCGPEVD